MTGTDKVLLAWSLAVLGGLVVGICALLLGGLIADRIRSVLREREHASAGSAEQAAEHKRMRLERENNRARTPTAGLSEAERLRRSEWRARINTEIADIDGRFDALMADFDPDERIAWKVDVSRDALDSITREQVIKLGPPDPALVMRWAATDPGIPRLPGELKRRDIKRLLEFADRN